MRIKTLGACLGATSLQYVIVRTVDTRSSVEAAQRIAHEGNPGASFLGILKSLDLGEIDRIAVTGRSLRHKVTLSSISEPEAVEHALRADYGIRDLPDTVVSFGGETLLAYSIGSAGGIDTVCAGNKCASGTGEFFLQQIKRMGLSLSEAIELGLRGTPHKVAGRCSVFCKSDCTHALNKGESREDIIAGLCAMMASKILELVKGIPHNRILLTGGGSLNAALIAHLRRRIARVEVSPHSAVFEAYGAALWAASNECRTLSADIESVVSSARATIARRPSLADAQHLVDFHVSTKKPAESSDRCVLGLDVGSTTTKAALVRLHDRAIVTSVYLRTNGDPIHAARNCYREIVEQTAATPPDVIAIGVTGSGRRIAALHASTKHVVNEILAHATAAVYFDPHVETIFEIGGQDAKYTRLTRGVPSDYAMNEACSAGTGSFLEEAARESLNIDVMHIGERAMTGMSPPGFTDQCSAFIAGDIKLALQEGVGKGDVLAGLVYAVCLNYLNKVKGPRPAGGTIFMQGGVCYNRAIPVAMASLLGCRIIVPPDPGLMGAFGVALETIKQVECGICSETGSIDLLELSQRAATRESSFRCGGGRDKCDLKCDISRIRVGNERHLFGGMCSRYDSDRQRKQDVTATLDFVAVRLRLLFEEFGAASSGTDQDCDRQRASVGLMRSFLTHSLYPFYSNFFDRLGLDIVLADAPGSEGSDFAESAFCFPAEQTHASFINLLLKKPTNIFLPLVTQIPVADPSAYTKTCVFIQGEHSYLRSTFRAEIEQSGVKVLSPVLCMHPDYEAAESAMVSMAHALGISKAHARDSFLFACARQKAFEQSLLEHGRDAMRYLSRHQDVIGMVLFGRPYNALAREGNMGIPNKFASRGVMALPLDMLPSTSHESDNSMFWAMGQKIMRTARFVRDHDQLFGCYITNFSCGPDSFLLTFFRDCMQSKPSLTLELDQHTADAGIDTRIEAAIEIMKGFRRTRKAVVPAARAFLPAKVTLKKEIRVRDSNGNEYPLAHPRVEVIFPSMGRYGTEVLAAVFRSMGINAHALSVPSGNELAQGRRYASCKECLPYIMTTGPFLSYLKQRASQDIVTLCFLTTGGGPCRMGQYTPAFEQTIRNQRIPNAAVLNITDENGFGGMGRRTLLRAWQAIVISDLFSDLKSVLSVTSAEPEPALETLESAWQDVIEYFAGSRPLPLVPFLSGIAERLKSIPLRYDPHTIPTVSLIGEIFVRKEEFSRKGIVEYLENNGFVVRVAPIAEYMHYGNYVITHNLGERQFSLKEKFAMRLTAHVQCWWERRIKRTLARSGLVRWEEIDIDDTVADVGHLVDRNFRGETILTIGLGLREILHHACGVISIGPFGCMPSRIAEAVLKREMNTAGMKRMRNNGRIVTSGVTESFPFLAVETDGSAFSLPVIANLEAFMLRARRVHEAKQSVAPQG